MWTYASLPVRNEICRKLLFNNLSIVRPIKIIFDLFLSGGSTDAVCKVSCKLVKSPGKS